MNGLEEAGAARALSDIDKVSAQLQEDLRAHIKAFTSLSSPPLPPSFVVFGDGARASVARLSRNGHRVAATMSGTTTGLVGAGLVGLEACGGREDDLVV